MKIWVSPNEYRIRIEEAEPAMGRVFFMKPGLYVVDAEEDSDGKDQ